MVDPLANMGGAHLPHVYMRWRCLPLEMVTSNGILGANDQMGSEVNVT